MPGQYSEDFPKPDLTPEEIAQDEERKRVLEKNMKKIFKITEQIKKAERGEVMDTAILLAKVTRLEEKILDEKIKSTALRAKLDEGCHDCLEALRKERDALQAKLDALVEAAKDIRKQVSAASLDYRESREINITPLINALREIEEACE